MPHYKAGHFNDFIEMVLLRSAIYKAVERAGSAGIHHDVLPQKVFDALGLDFSLYAVDATVRFAQRNETERALREALGYRIYRDLKRGWRITSPNLEQCGLLDIEYTSLDDVCSAEAIHGKILTLCCWSNLGNTATSLQSFIGLYAPRVGY